MSAARATIATILHLLVAKLLCHSKLEVSSNFQAIKGTILRRRKWTARLHRSKWRANRKITFFFNTFLHTPPMGWPNWSVFRFLTIFHRHDGEDMPFMPDTDRRSFWGLILTFKLYSAEFWQPPLLLHGRFKRWITVKHPWKVEKTPKSTLLCAPRTVARMPLIALKM